MKKILFVVCISILGATEAFACIDSGCKPCPFGFSLVKKCCSSTDKNDCVICDKKIEDCGEGKWQEYPYSLRVETNECCKDATENYCTFRSHFKGYCGEGEFAAFPYSPVKKCCKDGEGKDCVVIRAKKKCGEYQMEKYPQTEPDCCNSLFNKCTGHVNDCPKCL